MGDIGMTLRTDRSTSYHSDDFAGQTIVIGHWQDMRRVSNAEYIELRPVPPDITRKEGPSSPFSAPLSLIFPRDARLFDPPRRMCEMAFRRWFYPRKVLVGLGGQTQTSQDYRKRRQVVLCSRKTCKYTSRILYCK
jgi:hypothetical protein